MYAKCKHKPCIAYLMGLNALRANCITQPACAPVCAYLIEFESVTIPEKKKTRSGLTRLCSLLANTLHAHKSIVVLDIKKEKQFHFKLYTIYIYYINTYAICKEKPLLFHFSLIF